MSNNTQSLCISHLLILFLKQKSNPIECWFSHLGFQGKHQHVNDAFIYFSIVVMTGLRNDMLYLCQ